jgi:hypothetical protein
MSFQTREKIQVVKQRKNKQIYNEKYKKIYKLKKENWHWKWKKHFMLKNERNKKTLK